MEAIIWLGIAIFLIIVEITTLGLTTIWFAGGAFVAGIAALFHIEFQFQIILFLAISLLLLFFTRPVAIKYLNNKITRTNVDSLIGTRGMILIEVNNHKEQGKVRLDGMEWTARAETDGEIIPVDALVEVVKIDGVKAIVKRSEQ